MSDGKEDQRTLKKNSIIKFILRIDTIPNGKYKIADLASEMSKYFDRTEKRQLNGFTFNFTKGNSQVKKNNSFHYVLISEKDSVSMTFSEPDNAFWIESNSYKSNAIYRKKIETLISIITDKNLNIESKRIGLRYVNEFKCGEPESISNIYGKRLSSILKKMLGGKNQSRIIGIEEENDNGFKLRMQYGIPNKFYPSVLSVYDLVLDTDSYYDSKSNPLEWEEIIAKLNHKAYKKFVNVINPYYLEGLK